MNILFITHGADMMGANRCLFDLLLILKQKGIVATVALPAHGIFEKKLLNAEISTIIIPYNNWAFTKYISIGYWVKEMYHRQNQKLLVNWTDKMESYKFDIIYSNTSLTGIGAMLAEKLNIPHLWHIREFGEADYNKAFLGGRSLFNHWANKATKIIAMSKAIKNEVLSELKTSVQVVHDGIYFKKNLPTLPLSDGDIFTFLIIGLIHPTKGQFLALKAFNAIIKEGVKAQLRIVGKGRRIYLRRMKLYVKQNGLEDHVDFLGYIDNPWKAHADASALLMCSRSEGMGRVTLESLYAGNPVLGFNRGGTKELIINNVDGFLFEDFNAELPELMMRLVSDKELRDRLGNNGKHKVLRDYSIEDSAEKIYKILEEIKREN